MAGPSPEVQPGGEPVEIAAQLVHRGHEHQPLRRQLGCRAASAWWPSRPSSGPPPRERVRDGRRRPPTRRRTRPHGCGPVRTRPGRTDRGWVRRRPPPPGRPPPAVRPGGQLAAVARPAMNQVDHRPLAPGRPRTSRFSTWTANGAPPAVSDPEGEDAGIVNHPRGGPPATMGPTRRGHPAGGRVQHERSCFSGGRWVITSPRTPVRRWVRAAWTSRPRADRVRVAASSTAESSRLEWW